MHFITVCFSVAVYIEILMIQLILGSRELKFLKETRTLYAYFSSYCGLLIFPFLTLRKRLIFICFNRLAELRCHMSFIGNPFGNPFWTRSLTMLPCSRIRKLALKQIMLR